MTIDHLQNEDLEQVSLMTPEGWDDLRVPFQYNLDTGFCLPLKAVVDGQLAGLGNVIHNGDSAWLTQIVVPAAFRNRGIGKAITGALLEHVDRQRYPTILLDATDMGYPVYSSFGFETISRHVHFNGTLLPGSSLPDPSVIPFEETYAEAVKKLDREATGEDRTGSLLPHLADAKLYREEEEITGVYFPTWFRGAILARTADAATALTRLRLQERTHAMMPEENMQGMSLMQRYGFGETRRSRRMRLGKARDWTPEYIYNATGGALG